MPDGAVDEPLVTLTRSLDAHHARSFVEGQLAPLIEHDRRHGTDLLGVLELALDADSHTAAAEAAYMHRNTFRRHLRRALDLIDVDLGCPEQRLALHLALKIRCRARG